LRGGESRCRRRCWLPRNLRLPRLYPILDTAALARRRFEPVMASEALLDEGVRILQYRHKGLFTQERFEEAARIAGLCRSAGALFVMNDRADFALMLRAGLHLGQDDLPPGEARKVVGDDLVMGFSTHNERQFLEADELPVGYLALGPIFATESKENPDPVLGVAELQRLRSRTNKPLVAIGGIKPNNASAVIGAGANSIALISGILPQESGDLAALRLLIRTWMKAVSERN
jgi:thiamine-phosphate pyrophosphorylase